MTEEMVVMVLEFVAEEKIVSKIEEETKQAKKVEEAEIFREETKDKIMVETVAEK